MNKQEAIEEIKQADERLWQFAKPLGDEQMHQISEEDFQFLKDGCRHIMSIAMNYANPFASDMEDWGSVYSDADLMLRVLEEVE